MKIDEQIFKRIQNYMLIGVLVLVFFLVVHAVFSNAMINAGDNEYIAENSVNSETTTYDTIIEDEEMTQPTSSISKSENSKYEVITVKPQLDQTLNPADSNNAVAPATTPMIPTATRPTQPTTVAPAAATPTAVASTTAAPTTAVPTTVATTTVAHTTAAPTTVAHTTVDPTTVPATTEPSSTDPSVSTAPTTEPSSTDPSASTAPTTEPSSTDPSASTAPTTEPSSTAPSASVEPTTQMPSTNPSVTNPTEVVEPTTRDPLSEVIQSVGDTLNDLAGKDKSTRDEPTAPAATNAGILSPKNEATPDIVYAETDNTVPTGAAPMGIVILVTLLSVALAAYFANRRTNE